MTYGDGPYSCYFCDQLADPKRAWGEVYRGRCPWFLIHHVDGDRTNNDPSNLAAAHKGCHDSHHDKLAWQLGIGFGAAVVTVRRHATLRSSQRSSFYDPVLRGKAAAAGRLSQETNKKARFDSELQSKLGRRGAQRANELHRLRGTGWFDSELQRQLGRKGGRIAASVRVTCDQCGLESNRAGMGTHQKFSGHNGRTFVVA